MKFEGIGICEKAELDIYDSKQIMEKDETLLLIAFVICSTMYLGLI